MATTTASTVQRHRGELARRNVIGGILALGRHILLIMLCLFAIAPLAWATSTAFKPTNEVFTNAGLIPHEPTLANFTYVLQNTQFARWFRNTLLIALATTFFSVSIAT